MNSYGSAPGTAMMVCPDAGPPSRGCGLRSVRPLALVRTQRLKFDEFATRPTLSVARFLVGVRRFVVGVVLAARTPHLSHHSLANA